MKDEVRQAESNTPGAPPDQPWERRLEALESRLSFQDDWLETLDALVRDQTQEVERLTRLTSLMRERLREQRHLIDELGGDTPSFDNEPPPHY